MVAALLPQEIVVLIAVVVSVQALLITSLSTLLAWFCRDDPPWGHRIWLTAVVLLLLLIPAHGLWLGWPVHALGTASNNLERGETSQFQDSSSNPLKLDDLSYSRSVGPIVSLNPDGDLPTEIASVTARSTEQSWPVQAPNDNVRFDGSSNALRLERMHTMRLPLTRLLIGGYLLGVCWCLVRQGWGMWCLRALTKSGDACSVATEAAFKRAADRIGLRKLPRIRLVDRISMPMTCGLLRAMVVLPKHFEAWPESEQRAVAMHELMHIKRRDVICESLARCMRAFYWFHPASRFIAQRLMLTRELATDQSVVACGEEREAYARSVVDVLTRLNLHTQPRPISNPPVVYMSAIGNLEVRLKSILEQRSQHSSAPRGYSLITVMLVGAWLTTLRLEVANAQTGSNKPVTAESQNNLSAEELQKPSAQSSDSDLFNRMRDCEVLSVTGEDYESEFDVSGQVLSPSGQPVAGAIVLLRESSTARISAEYLKYLQVPQRHLIRVNDVFARTISNGDGRFQFNGVKAPAMPSNWSNSWKGDIVAGHPQQGIGWIPLGKKQERRRVEPGLTIALSPTTTIAGNYVSPAGTPLTGAVVNVYRYELLSKSPAFTSNYLDLQASQLTPHATTGAAGEFMISGVPQGFLVRVIGADHEPWLGTSAVIASSDGIPLGRQQDFTLYGNEEVEVLQSPVNLVADRGMRVEGIVVDDQGRGIQGALVSMGSSLDVFSSDENGHFSMHLKSNFTKVHDLRGEGSVKIVLRPPKNSDLLMGTETVSVDEVLSGKPIRLSM
jgi:beta-lactamase regulating signal transducer with metallopeptidase domain